MNQDISDQEIETAVAILNKLNPGFLPFKLFFEVARLTTTPIVELVPFRRNGDSIEVLLIRRKPDDIIWPNQLHNPGTVLRSTDSLESALSRIVNEELKGTILSEPKFVTNIHHDSGRGSEVAEVFWAEVFEDNGVGEFYDVNNLPEDIIKSQLDYIPLALQSYKGSLN